MENYSDGINEENALIQLSSGYEKAQETLNDKDRMDDFFEKLEEKLKEVPNIGELLSNIAVMASMINSYIKKEYTNMPVGTVVAALSALIYLISPFDLISDIIPGLGFVDDAAVIAVCIKMIKYDLDKFKAWKEENKEINE